MTEFILTIGVSASGKSSFAQEQKKLGAFIIERDEIREVIQPGYWKGRPDSKIENRVTSIQRHDILEVMGRVSRVVISDTNLNPIHLAELTSFLYDNGAEDVQCIWFEDSLDLRLCLTRNAARERQVPEDVMLKQWKQYQNLYNAPAYKLSSENRPIVWISDTHSCVGKLRQVFDLYPSETYQYIFNGDINDSNLDFSNDVSFLETFYEVYEVVETHGGILLHSNHQKNLVNLLAGRRKKLGHGLDYTAAELTWLGLELEFAEDYATSMMLKSSSAEAGVLQDMRWWLATRPVQVQFRHNRLFYRCAHAWSHQSSPFEPFPKSDELNIYGPTAGRSQRIEWWLERDALSSVDVISLSGHYHHVYQGKHCIVYDPNCGQEGGQLGYIVFEDEIPPQYGAV